MERTVKIYPDGTRKVGLHSEMGDWGMAYVIMPREVVLHAIRQARAEGRSLADVPWQTACNYGLSQAFYGGPGLPFVHPMSRQRSSRRYVVFAQTAGLDV